MLCKYKHSLGVPGKGIHTHLFGIAITDVIMTVLFAWILSRVFKWKFMYVVILFFLLGIIAHRIFCVPTTIDKLLFPVKN